MYIDFLKNENLKKKTFYDIDDHQNALSQSVKMVYCQLVKFIFKTVLCLQACRDATDSDDSSQKHSLFFNVLK